MLATTLSLLACLSVYFNVWNGGLPVYFNVFNDVRPITRKLISSTAKWTRKQTRRVFRSKRSSRSRSRNTRTKANTGRVRSSSHFASGHLNVSHYPTSGLFFGPQLLDIVPARAHLSLITTVSDLALRLPSALQAYQPLVCPAWSLSYESSTDLVVRTPGHLSVFEPWRLVTSLSLFVSPAALFASQAQLPTTVATEDDLDWWNPWYACFALLFWIVAFAFLFPNPHKKQHKKSKKSKKSNKTKAPVTDEPCSLCIDTCPLCKDTSAPVATVTPYDGFWLATIPTTSVGRVSTSDVRDSNVTVPQVLAILILASIALADPPLPSLDSESLDEFARRPPVKSQMSFEDNLRSKYRTLREKNARRSKANAT